MLGDSFLGFSGSSAGKESPCTAGDLSPILGREDPWRRDRLPTPVFSGFPGGSDSKESAHNAGDLGSIRGLERSTGEVKGYPLQFRRATGEGKGYRLQYSVLENSLDCI